MIGDPLLRWAKCVFIWFVVALPISGPVVWFVAFGPSCFVSLPCLALGTTVGLLYPIVALDAGDYRGPAIYLVVTLIFAIVFQALSSVVRRLRAGRDS